MRIKRDPVSTVPRNKNRILFRIRNELISIPHKYLHLSILKNMFQSKASILFSILSLAGFLPVESFSSLIVSHASHNRRLSTNTRTIQSNHQPTGQNGMFDDHFFSEGPPYHHCLIEVDLKDIGTLGNKSVEVHGMKLETTTPTFTSFGFMVSCLFCPFF